MLASLLIQLFIVLAIPSIVRLRSGRLLESPHFERWAWRFGVTLTDETTPYVREHLATSMRWRHRGGAIGFTLANIPLLIETVSQKSLGIPSTAGIAVLGYLVGTAFAEGIRWRRGLTGVSRATLDNRAPSDYVAPWARRAFWALLMVSALIVGMAINNPTGDRERLGAPIAAAVIALAAALVEWALHAIARRPQAAAAQDLVAADNAVRSYSSHVLVGLGIGVISFNIAPLASDRTLFWTGLAKTVGSGVAVIAPLLLIGVARFVATDSPWRNRSSRFAVATSGQVTA